MLFFEHCDQLGFQIPGIANANAKEEEKKLVYPSAVLSKIREAAQYRPEHIRSAFSQELFGVLQCIAQTSKSLYHRQKSSFFIYCC